VSLEVAEAYRRKNRDVFVIDLDYKLHDCLRFAFKGLPRAPLPRVPCLVCPASCALPRVLPCVPTACAGLAIFWVWAGFIRKSRCRNAC